MKRSFILSTLLLTLATSCRKFITIDPSPELVRTSEVFSTPETALSAARGVYLQLRAGSQSISAGGLPIYTGLYSDELAPTSTVATFMAFYENELLPINSTVSSLFYQSAYRSIYSCNSLLEGVAISPAIDSNLARQLSGEMKVIRAWLYFNLVNLFSDVPLITTTDYRNNEKIGRISASTIYQFLESSLQESITDFIASGTSVTKTRIGVDAASLLLARVYLYQEKYTLAKEMANALIESGRYTLTGSSGIANVFKQQHTETIFEIAAPNGNQAVAEAGTFVPSTGTVRPPFILQPSLLALFESGDARRIHWVGQNIVGGIEYSFPFKYKERSIVTGNQASEYSVVFRIPEAYLIRAEAYTKLDQLDSANADLSKMKVRAGLPSTSFSDPLLMLEEIEKERFREFFTEGGHRFFDLKRVGKANDVLGMLKPNTWQITDLLWPIPENELLYNSLLTQNPGY